MPTTSLPPLVISSAKNMSLPPNWSCSKNISSLAQKLSKTADAIKQPIEWLRKYYSIILEKEISMKQTALLLETQLAFAMAIMPADMHLLLRAASLGWFCLCLKRCKKSL